MIPLDQVQLRAIDAAAKKSDNGVKRALDPADETDSAAIKAFLALSGKTPDTHPALYSDIDRMAGEAAAGNADHPSQVLDIVDRGRDARGNATARVWHLDTEGTYAAGSVALALDADSGKPVALGYANRVGGGLCPAATRSATAAPAPARMTTLGFFHSQATPEAAPLFGMVAATADVPADGGGYTWSVTAPVGKDPAAVQIGLGRGKNPQNPSFDLDYAYTRDQDASQLPILILVPFTGTVNVGQPLDTSKIGPSGTFSSGFVCSIQLLSIVTGGTYAPITSGRPDPASLPKGSGSTVTWSYPFDDNAVPAQSASLAFGLIDSTGAPIVSAKTPTLCAFRCDFTIPVQDPTVGTVTATVCSTDWPQEGPSSTCKTIQPLQFWFHCLAFGTQVTLADGSTLAIEKVDNGKRVRTGQGNGSLGVEATTQGRHDRIEPGHPVSGIFELKTAGGLSLVLTGGHPVATEDGLMRASDLSPGVPLHTERGPDRVASIEPVEFDGMFANLKLVDASDRARGLGAALGTFVANGIVVGDHPSMERLHYNHTHSIDYMKARLPERQHIDYASTLLTIAQDNARYGGNY